MTLHPSIISPAQPTTQEFPMTQSTVSPFNPRTIQTLEINPMVNHYVAFQSALFSFNNSALYIGGRKATKQQLVPLIAKAQVQLQTDLTSAVNRGSFGYAQRCGESLTELQRTTAQLCLNKDVAHYIADRTPTRG